MARLMDSQAREQGAFLRRDPRSPRYVGRPVSRSAQSGSAILGAARARHEDIPSHEARNVLVSRWC